MARIILLSYFLFHAATCVEAQEKSVNLLVVSPPPTDLGLSPFYKKHVDYLGLPIVCSEKVPDRALFEAHRIIEKMVAKRKDLVPLLIKNKVRVVVMATSELTTDIPEHSDLKPKAHWDKRARGLGATRARPASTCAEENLLGYPEDRYKGESILVHEFAHTLHELAIVDADKTFDAKLKASYENAMNRGLWVQTYAATDHKEYWAEGVQSWFNANKEVLRANGIHNEINTHRELVAYDPALAILISEWFLKPPENTR